LCGSDRKAARGDRHANGLRKGIVMTSRSKNAGLILMVALMVLALAAWALVGCGGDEGTETTAAPDTTAASETTAAEPAAGGVEVTGLVDSPTTLTVEMLEGMTPETLTVEHPKKGQVEYTGVRFSAVLEALGVQAGAATVVLAASDGFMAEVPLADIAASPDSLLAIEDGTISSVFPGLETKTWVKDIVSMEFK
jgi:hypothetical protein